MHTDKGYETHYQIRYLFTKVLVLSHNRGDHWTLILLKNTLTIGSPMGIKIILVAIVNKNKRRNLNKRTLMILFCNQ
jgi:hypothetical protein